MPCVCLNAHQVDQDMVTQQRVSESLEKMRRQFSDERQRLVVEANKQMRESVSSARLEVESKMKQAQATALQDALREANVQTTSKEVWIAIPSVLSGEVEA